MIELIQIPYSPFCLVQRRILEFAGVRFRIRSIPNGDRSLVWRLTKQRYDQVPIIRDGRTVVFETDDESQVIAKYLDNKFGLGLFPREWAGIQFCLWRYFENDLEALTFRLNDIYWQEMIPPTQRLAFRRHKERKFGRGCLEQWAAEQAKLLEELAHRLVPCEQMLMHRPFLLAGRPLFADFDLYGMLANFLYSGHYQLPAAHNRLQDWYARMSQASFQPAT
jgi:glutathione S-transferase